MKHAAPMRSHFVTLRKCPHFTGGGRFLASGDGAKGVAKGTAQIYRGVFLAI
jgi:hypothetical protein